jgi:L-alanine-DL-glutamate epimerase-like enolase superfamily enzyme
MEYGFFPSEFLMTTEAIEIDKDGNAIIPKKPGLGFDLDETLLERYQKD